MTVFITIKDMNIYTIRTDFGLLYIEADSAEEAMKIAKETHKNSTKYRFI